MDAGNVAFERGHRHIRGFAGTNRFEETLPLASFFGFRCVFRDRNPFALAHWRFSFALFVGVETLFENVEAFRAKESIAAVSGFGLFIGAEIAHLESHDGAIGISKSGRLSVGGLAVVVQTIPAAGAVDFDRK